MKGMRSGRAGLLACVILVASASTARAEGIEVGVKGPPPRTLKGEVIRQNLRGVILKSDGDPVTLAWSDVDTVNGRPVRDHVTRLAQTLKDVLCPDCRGGLVSVLCSDCLGTAKIYSRSRPCEKCAGSGTHGTPCKAKGCDQGKLECPAPCLKRGVGIWKEQVGYGLCRIFIFNTPKGVGTGFVSEKHLGQIVEFKEVEPFARPECPKCKGVAKTPCKECREAGTYIKEHFKVAGDCRICGGGGKGAGRIPCPACLGTASQPCGGCGGAKVVPVPESTGACGSCKEGRFRCSTCAETGLHDPAAPPPRTPQGPPLVAALRAELRTALASLDDFSFSATDRVSLPGGRGVEGRVILRTYAGILLLSRPSPGSGFLLLAVLYKQGFRLEAMTAPARPADPPSPPDPVAKPSPGPDTVVLKDGTRVNGRILIRNEDLIMIQTPDGKRVKIEKDQIAEIKSEPKK